MGSVRHRQVETFRGCSFSVKAILFSQENIFSPKHYLNHLMIHGKITIEYHQSKSLMIFLFLIFFLEKTEKVGSTFQMNFLIGKKINTHIGGE